MKVLIPHTRELCYYSGSFFLRKIAETLEKQEVSVSFLELSDDEADFDILENASKEKFDCVFDINSKLPYLITDSGEYFADTLDIPVFDYILDHPLYHAPGLLVPLKNYHAITIDKYHERFAKDHLKTLQSVDYLPVPGTEAKKTIPFGERKYPLCFSGTYEMEDSILYDIRDKGQLTFDVSMDMISLMDDLDMRVEKAAERVLMDRYGSVQDAVSAFGFDSFAMTLNHLCRTDKYVRFKRRHETIEALGNAGCPMLLFGSGWDMMDIERFKNIETITHVSIPVSFELMAESRAVLDINPLFAAGFHDRVSSAMANSCVCLSDMGTEAEAELKDGVNYISYSTGKLDDLCDKAWKVIGDTTFAERIALNGRKLFEEKYNWQTHGEKLYDILQNT